MVSKKIVKSLDTRIRALESAALHKQKYPLDREKFRFRKIVRLIYIIGSNGKSKFIDVSDTFSTQIKKVNLTFDKSEYIY